MTIIPGWMVRSKALSLFTERRKDMFERRIMEGSDPIGTFFLNPHRFENTLTLKSEGVKPWV